MEPLNIEVSYLTPEDLDWFVEVAAVNMLTEELKRPELVNKEQIQMLAKQVEEGGTAFVAKVDGKCVGALGALIVPNMFNPSFVSLVEVFWYVLPEYRTTKVGAMLLMAFDALGERLDVDDRTLSLLPSSQINVESLGRKGYILEEFGFRKGRK